MGTEGSVEFGRGGDSRARGLKKVGAFIENALPSVWIRWRYIPKAIPLSKRHSPPPTGYRIISTNPNAGCVQ
jgi:hypothetical protein